MKTVDRQTPSSTNRQIDNISEKRPLSNKDKHNWNDGWTKGRNGWMREFNVTFSLSHKGLIDMGTNTAMSWNALIAQDDTAVQHKPSV